MASDLPAAPGASPRDATDLPWRVMGLLNIYRLLVPMVLLLVFLFDAPARSVGSLHPGLFVGICAAYFAFGLVCVNAIQRRWPSVIWQALFQLAVDGICITLLIFASGGVDSGLATLLILPVAATAAIIPPRLALAATSLITIGLLFETTLSVLTGVADGSDFLITGLTGASLFAVTLLAIPLAGRLRETEALVMEKEADLASVNELNQYIVQHLRESILVVDGDNKVRLINQSAARMLSDSPVERGMLLGEVSPKLLYQLEAWRQQNSDRRDSVGEFVSADGGTVVRPHFVALGDSRSAAVLVFLEDTSILAARVQQTKLASLGRLSASIAHEIRNPVGAMSHAGQLLAESEVIGQDDRHLTEIIQKNARRVSQIIDNVLQLSRRDNTRQERIELREWTQGFLREFCGTTQQPETSFRIADAGDEALEVHFDPTQLHQVLWNLCENALKYGRSSGERPVELQLGRIASTGRPYVEVADRGPGIAEEHTERLFEPFFTNGAGGTGLGLFISRELCQTNGALLLYEPRPDGGSIFRVIFADPQRWQS
jgi:two-component system sensor histidine kinase PilS (NtrC family)